MTQGIQEQFYGFILCIIPQINTDPENSQCLVETICILRKTLILIWQDLCSFGKGQLLIKSY